MNRIHQTFISNLQPSNLGIHENSFDYGRLT